MTSINYSASSSSAIRVLQSVNKDLEKTQNRISTGYKVNSAADNASIWKAASGMRSDIKSYEAASASMDYAKGVFTASAASVDAVSDILSQIKTVITTGASASGSARTTADASLASLQAQLKNLIEDAGVGGVNLLKGDTAPSYFSAFSTTGAATAGTTVTTYNLSNDTTNYVGDQDATMFGSTTSGGTTTNHSILDTTIAKMAGVTGGIDVGLDQLAVIISNVSDYGASLSSAANRIQSTQDIMSKLADIRKTALGNMVDADLEEESAKLSALQVKQQLATQALSIANQSASNILRLFQ